MALTLFAAWETSENNGVPLLVPVWRGNATLKCHAPDGESRLPQLARSAEMHLHALDRAIADLSRLLRHCQEARAGQFQQFAADVSESCRLLEVVRQAFEECLPPAWQS